MQPTAVFPAGFLRTPGDQSRPEHLFGIIALSPDTLLLVTESAGLRPTGNVLHVMALRSGLPGAREHQA